MAFTEDQISRLRNLQEMKGYYMGKSKGLFEGESIVCLKILDYIESQQNLNEESVFKIAEVYGEISAYDHLNGSGWFDFQIRLGSFLWGLGYDSDFNSEPGKLHVEKLTAGKN